MKTSSVLKTTIENKIIFIRGQKVMLDKDLAILYDVQTRELNKAVTRNPDRFPMDFCFQLTQLEFKNLMFQFGTSSWGGTRKMPRVFTEQGIAMLSSVLRSKRAIRVNVEIMRAFVRLRKILTSHKKLSQRLDALERKYDVQFKAVFEAIRQLMKEEEKPRAPMGFHVNKP
jgi:hypothetical protein